MMIATRLLDRNQAALGKLFRQYAEAGQQAPEPEGPAGLSTSDELVVDVEATVADLASRSEEASARFEGRVVSFRGKIEEYGSIKRFLAELDRLTPNEEQYAAQARAFADGSERSVENKK